jgi:hypothetical protein
MENALARCNCAATPNPSERDPSEPGRLRQEARSHPASAIHRSVARIAVAHRWSAGCPRCSDFPISQIARNAPDRASSSSSRSSWSALARPTRPFKIDNACCGGARLASINACKTSVALPRSFIADHPPDSDALSQWATRRTGLRAGSSGISSPPRALPAARQRARPQRMLCVPSRTRTAHVVKFRPITIASDFDQALPTRHDRIETTAKRCR